MGRELLSILVLSYNRREALLRTLRELDALATQDQIPREVIVIDNASADGSVDAVRKAFPAVRVLALDANLGVAGFNRGAAQARGDVLLILDDDAWPQSTALRSALALMRERPRVAGVALLPVHPSTQRSEWPFATVPHDHFPVMGCGNLVRADAWRSVGGYEEAFFLYRNDVDLAMKLLGAGWQVAFDPAWIVWHDSPASGAPKGERWLHGATRNWCWLCRRHGRGLWRGAGIAAQALWSLREAGLHRARLRAWARGLRDGMMDPAPPLPPGVLRDGAALREYLRLRRGPP